MSAGLAQKSDTSTAVDLSVCVEKALSKTDFLIVEDNHSFPHALQFVSNPEMMKSFAKSGVTRVDPEFLNGECKIMFDAFSEGKVPENAMRQYTEIFNHDFGDHVPARVRPLMMNAYKEMMVQANANNIGLGHPSHDDGILDADLYPAFDKLYKLRAEFFISALKDYPKLADMPANELRDLFEGIENQFYIDKGNEIEPLVPTIMENDARDVQDLLRILKMENSLRARAIENSPTFGEYPEQDFFRIMSSMSKEGRDRVALEITVKRLAFDDKIAGRMMTNETGKTVGIMGAAHLRRPTGDVDWNIGEDKTKTLLVVGMPGASDPIEGPMKAFQAAAARMKIGNDLEFTDKSDYVLNLVDKTWTDRATGEVVQVNLPEGLAPGFPQTPKASMSNAFDN